MADETDHKGFNAWASQATVERHHTESKSQFSALHAADVALVQRIHALEIHSADQAQQLNKGAETFTRTAERMDRIEASQRPTWKTIAAVALVVGGWIWTMARYPDPQEMGSVKREVQLMQLQQNTLGNNIADLQKDVARFEKKQDSIDAKLDRVLSKP